MRPNDCSDLGWLAGWYASQCNGEWEHKSGIEFGTLDNPGWMLRIDLRATGLEGRHFDKVEHGRAASDLIDWQETGSWWVVEVKDDKFVAACGPLDLDRILSMFRAWAEGAMP